MLEDGINSSRGSMRNTVGSGRFTCDKLACESRSFTLHMTQMWVNITCFYPICHFPKTKKLMSEDLSTVSTPFPSPKRNIIINTRTHKQENDTEKKKQTHIFQGSLFLLNISTSPQRSLFCFFQAQKLTMEISIGKALNLKLPDGILGILKPTMYQSEVSM